MKNRDRYFLIKATLIFALGIWIVALAGIGLWDLVGKDFFIGWIALGLLLVAVIFGFAITSYVLSPLFKTNRLLDYLLKDTLHELNIPLSVIKANLQMLQSDEIDTKKSKRLERIALASDDLYRLYQEVDYYIKKEIREDVKEVFDLCELVANVVEKFDGMAQKPQIKQDISHVELLADKHGFAKVITNLLSNAIKYNQDYREIEIVQKEHQLIVRDYGVGMSESELFLVFDRYYQGDYAQQGHGIGLSIVKAYCDDFKIFVNINSKKGEGTEVILDISNLLYKK